METISKSMAINAPLGSIRNAHEMLLYIANISNGLNYLWLIKFLFETLDYRPPINFWDLADKLGRLIGQTNSGAIGLFYTMSELNMIEEK